jgi:hypothetical protein
MIYTDHVDVNHDIYQYRLLILLNLFIYFMGIFITYIYFKITFSQT